MSEPSATRAAVTGSEDEPQTFALSGQQDEPGTASLVDVRTPKSPAQDSPPGESGLKKKLDPFGLFTLSKKKE